jgi:hypothetical protein
VLNKLLTNAAEVPGSIVTRSGFAPPYNSEELYFGSVNTPAPYLDAEYEGGVEFIALEAPPPGEVLWLSLAMNWHLFHWEAGDPRNNSSRSMRVDFGSKWAWDLITNSSSVSLVTGRVFHKGQLKPGFFCWPRPASGAIPEAVPYGLFVPDVR